jgi:hypothetical protein
VIKSVFYFCIKNRVNRLLQLTKAKQREKIVKDCSMMKKTTAAAAAEDSKR